MRFWSPRNLLAWCARLALPATPLAARRRQRADCTARCPSQCGCSSRGEPCRGGWYSRLPNSEADVSDDLERNKEWCELARGAPPRGVGVLRRVMSRLVARAAARSSSLPGHFQPWFMEPGAASSWAASRSACRGESDTSSTGSPTPSPSTRGANHQPRAAGNRDRHCRRPGDRTRCPLTAATRPDDQDRSIGHPLGRDPPQPRGASRSQDYVTKDRGWLASAA